MKKYFVALTALTLTACGAPAPTAEELAVQQAAERRVQAEQVEQRRIQSLREQNPEVNWLMVGITTGKYSEDIAAEVYRTHDECRQNQPFEDTECVAIAALPESYWTTK